MHCWEKVYWHLLRIFSRSYISCMMLWRGSYCTLTRHLGLLSWMPRERDPLHRYQKKHDLNSRSPCAFVWPREIEQRPESCCPISNYHFLQARLNELRNHVYDRKLRLALMGRLSVCHDSPEARLWWGWHQERKLCHLASKYASKNDLGTNQSCS